VGYVDCSTADRLREQELVEAGLRRALHQAGTTAAVNTDDPAGRIRTVEANGLVVEMDVVSQEIGLDDIVWYGEAQLGKVAPQTGGKYASTTITARRTRPGEIAGLEDHHLEL